MKQKSEYRILLIGNPNSGKSTLFNTLCSQRAKVANYSGVTVAKKLGTFSYDNKTVEVEDLPGTYTLASSAAEELITKNSVFDGDFDLIVNVIDSSNFERNLFLTLQLLEMNVPLVVLLNMTDELEKSGRFIDSEGLSKALLVPVIKSVAYKSGLSEELKSFICANLNRDVESCSLWDSLGDNVLNDSIKEISDVMHPLMPEGYKHLSNCIAIRCLENDAFILGKIESGTPKTFRQISDIIKNLENATSENPQVLVSAARYAVIKKVCMPFLCILDIGGKIFSKKLDAIFLNKFFGLPLFLGMMYLVFEFVFMLGEPLMSLLEVFFDFLKDSVSASWGGESVFKDFIVDGIIGSVGGVFIFLPNILLLFFALSILQDSGYMARAALLSDRLMKRFGLSGSSLIPMILGFGCSVPAIISTRSLKSNFERLATIVVIPLFSCGARLPVYLLLVPAFFAKEYRAAVTFGLYLFGIALALVLAKVLRTFLFRSKDTQFLIELPLYRIPRIKNVFNEVKSHSWDFIKRAGTIILVASVVLWAASTFPKNESNLEKYKSDIARVESDFSLSKDVKQSMILDINSKKNTERFNASLMGQLGIFVQPAFEPLGFDSKLISALIGSLAAKEAFIAQLNIIYGGEDGDTESFDLREKVSNDYTPIQGVSLLLFILISSPCIATISTTFAETKSLKIALLQFLGLTLVAYLVSLCFYTLANIFLV